MTVCSFSTQFSCSSLRACYWTVFTVCFSSCPQSLRLRVTPHNFTAVFVCNRSCCWIRANKAACDARRRAGNKGRHLSCVTFVRSFRNFLRVVEQEALLHVRKASRDTIGQSHTFATFSPGDHEIIESCHFPLPTDGKHHPSLSFHMTAASANIFTYFSTLLLTVLL